MEGPVLAQRQFGLAAFKRLVDLAVNVFQFLDVRLGDAFGCFFRRISFKHDSEGSDFLKFLAGYLWNSDFARTRHYQHALHDQLQQRIAHRRGADAHLLGNLLYLDGITREKIAVENCISDLIVDGGAKGFAYNCSEFCHDFSDLFLHHVLGIASRQRRKVSQRHPMQYWYNVHNPDEVSPAT